MVDAARLVFDEVRIWEPLPDPVPVDRLVEGFGFEDRAFIEAMYEMAARLYAKFPPRHNGQASFAHPTNVALFLVRARTQPHIIAAGLLHDVIEDRMVFEKAVAGHRDGERVERAIRGEFGEIVIEAASRTHFPRDIAERLVEVVWTLTRHKSDLYYKSISGIFMHPDPSIRVAAALVKLADRMHNIQTIENYREDEQIYQCFKNIFILNNSKHLRVEMHARGLDTRMAQSLEKMFKKCGKATFQALLRIDRRLGAHLPDGTDAGTQAHHLASMFSICSILALALRKFMLEIEGLWSVTEGSLDPGEPVFNLYHGIVKKYDHMLHHEDLQFREHVKREIAYCRATFADLALSDDQLLRAIRYKDALALMEVVGSLLYLDGYVIRGFQCSRMCRRNQNCQNLAQANDGLL